MGQNRRGDLISGDIKRMAVCFVTPLTSTLLLNVQQGGIYIPRNGCRTAMCLKLFSMLKIVIKMGAHFNSPTCL